MRLKIGNFHHFQFYFSRFQRHRKTQIDRLIADYTEVLNRFQTVQRDAAAKEKESIARARAASAAQDQNGDVLINIQGG